MPSEELAHCMRRLFEELSPKAARGLSLLTSEFRGEVETWRAHRDFVRRREETEFHESAERLWQLGLGTDVGEIYDEEAA